MKICKIIVLFLLVWSNTQAQRPFVTKWDTRKSRTSVKNQITIPTTGTGYNYTVEWGDGNTDTEVTGNITHTYSTPDIYTVNISGDFPRVYFNESIIDQKEALKLISIEQWGDINWTSMENAFSGCTNLQVNAFDAPDLSRVSSLKNMFLYNYYANPYVKNWDVSKVTDMSGMFCGLAFFNRNLSNWNVENVTDMSLMFAATSHFNQDISSWNVENVTNMASMFSGAKVFNQDISSWNVANVSDMSKMFKNAISFNQDIGTWNVGNVSNMTSMFEKAASFNQDIGSWNVENVSNMSTMFEEAKLFNSNIDPWNTKSVTNMSKMFAKSETFNQKITSWNVSNVIDMSNMFANAISFDEDISSWNVANVADMSYMFADATSFNQNISSWNVSNVTDMSYVFEKATSFNQDISSWNVSNVTDMSEMFANATSFNQNLGNWNIGKLKKAEKFLFMCGLSKANYDETLKGWANGANIPLGLVIKVSGLKYCSGAISRKKLIDNYNWDFLGDVQICESESFVTLWQTDIADCASGDNQIKIPTEGTGYNYTVDWGDGKTDNGVKGDIIHTYDKSGMYTVKITGAFPRIYFNEIYKLKDAKKLIAITQWGNNKWETMKGAFADCKNMVITAEDTPDLSIVKDMSFMFKKATSFNQSIDKWDVSNVENMSGLFIGASIFNQDISNWDMSNVKDMSSMFAGAEEFNQPVGKWDISNVYSMMSMFQFAAKFNQPIGGWNTNKMKYISKMFLGASMFNQPINEWNTSKITGMGLLFSGAASFNQDLSKWDVSNVENMDQMFEGAFKFNQDISGWNTSKVRYMKGVFSNASDFNQDISDWDLSNVNRTNAMFLNAKSFNQDISAWDLENVLFMDLMFSGADSFNQDLGAWNISNVQKMQDMFNKSNMSRENYDATLTGWASKSSTPHNITMGAEDLEYCNETGRNKLINDFGWTINYDTQSCIVWYTVTFNVNDGLTLKTVKVQEGEAAIAPIIHNTNPEYKFTGWDKDFSVVTSDLTITAQYSKNELKNYTVIFNDIDGTELKTEKVEFEKAATAPANPTKIGYTFTRWDINFDKVTSDLTITAQYSKNGATNYTVIFNDWNNIALKTETVVENDKATAPTNPVKIGYTFNGWDIDFNKIISDLTVTAEYSINTFNVVFNDDDGTELKTEKVEFEKSATAPSNPTKIGYTFTAWDIDFSKITSDLTVTAEYSINTFNVVFNDYDNSQLKTEKVEFEKSATAPANPTREGYTFKAWDITFDKVTADLIVTAQYDLINGINDIKIGDVNIYPNPVNDILHIDLNDLFLTEHQGIIIYNNIGNIVYQNKDKSAVQTIDLSGFVSGIYYVKVNNIAYKLLKN